MVELFVPKQEAVQAIQFTGDNRDEVKAFLTEHSTQYSDDPLGSGGELVVYTFTGPVICRLHSWVYYSSTAQGSCHVMANDLFQKRFEKKNDN